jgi:hypothetical protein
MKRLISAVMVVAVVVSVAPVLAGDAFHALSRLPAGLTPLDDTQLATVEGVGAGDFCYVCSNYANVNQFQWASQYGVAVFGDVEQDIEQEQESVVIQEIN